jgi:glycogen operon protein
MDDNLSWNCGVGALLAIRRSSRCARGKSKNCMALTLIAVGTPMLLMGDEVRRTQRENNNADCQDMRLPGLTGVFAIEMQGFIALSK